MQEKRYHGVLVTNAFLRTEKFTEHYEWLKRAAKVYSIDLSLFCNTDLLFPVCNYHTDTGRKLKQNVEKLVRENDFVIYWDKDIPLGKLLQACSFDICFLCIISNPKRRLSKKTAVKTVHRSSRLSNRLSGWCTCFLKLS